MILIDLEKIDFVEKKKENNMSNVEETSIKELRKIIADEAANSPLRWTDLRNDRIYIHNLADSDNVCVVQVYGAFYYLYFYNRKYGDIAKEIKDTNIIKVTDKGGYRFNGPGHVVSFIKKVVNKADHVNEKPITMKDLPTVRALDVIFNDPATIIIWADGSKTVVKAENEPFDPEKGLAMAISKKVLGNKYDYYDVFKKYIGRYEKKQKKGKK